MAKPQVELPRRALLAGAMSAGAAIAASRAMAQPPSEMDQWNAAERIPLWPASPPNGGFQPSADASLDDRYVTQVAMPELRVFRPLNSNGRSLIAIPGGAYRFVSIVNEGIDIANAMAARGYTVYVLVYRLPGEGWNGRADVPLQDARRAVRLVRSFAGLEGRDADKVYGVGFSAGGHLAATLATDPEEEVYAAVDAADELPATVAAMGLVYPVISHEPGIGHALSTELLLGEKPSPALVVRRSPALHVHAGTPPCFLVHSLDDAAVSSENSLLMLSALRAAGRPAEAHFFAEGGHGYGLGAQGTPARSWIKLFANWIERQQG